MENDYEWKEEEEENKNDKTAVNTEKKIKPKYQHWHSFIHFHILLFPCLLCNITRKHQQNIMLTPQFSDIFVLSFLLFFITFCKRDFDKIAAEALIFNAFRRIVMRLCSLSHRLLFSDLYCFVIVHWRLHSCLITFNRTTIIKKNKKKSAALPSAGTNFIQNDWNENQSKIDGILTWKYLLPNDDK